MTLRTKMCVASLRVRSRTCDGLLAPGRHVRVLHDRLRAQSRARVSASRRSFRRSTSRRRRAWTDGEMPTAAAGFEVSAFARGLDHPRWIYVLPNGDVLVAESNSPGIEPAVGFARLDHEARDGEGGRGRAQSQPHHPAARCRWRRRRGDADDVPAGPVLAVRNGAGRKRFLCRQHRCDRALPVYGRRDIDHGAGNEAHRPAGAPLNHHWTKNIIASKDGTKLYATVGSNSNIAENGFELEEGRAAIWEIDRATGRSRIFASGSAKPERTWRGSRRRARCGRRSTSATSSAMTSCRTTSRRFATADSTAGRTAITASMSMSA